MSPWGGPLGPRPIGDPAGMRAYAGKLRSAGSRIANTTSGPADGVDHATFVGPSGDAARFRAGRLRTRGRKAADQLRDLADDIVTRAGQVEDAQKAWDDTKDRLEREAREERERAAREKTYNA